MAKQDLARFAKDYLPQHPEVKQRIDGITDQNQFVIALLQAGTQAGFEFSADDVRDALARRGELSEDQLEAVAGGRKAGGEQQEYLKVTMTDVLISSYQ
jgi:hypothetical protein